MDGDSLEDMRARFKSNEDETGGDPAASDRFILETPPIMGMFSDMSDSK